MFVRRRALFEIAGNASGSFRRGLLLALEDDAGNVGYGEASPVPGLSREQIANCRWALESFSTLFEVEGEPDAVDAVVREIPPGLAAGRFAFETAMYDLLAKRQQTTMHALLGEQRDRIPLCQPYQEGDRIQASVVKVQAGLRSLSDDLDRIARIRRTIGSEVGLRVDFQRSISPLRLAAALSQLAAIGVELVEEPAPASALLKLGESPVPIALDESLLDSGDLIEDLANLGLVRVLVLKPMLLGGARVSQKIAEWAQQLGLAITVAHAFDGPIAHAMSSAIAMSLPGELLPIELWPHDVLPLWGERPMPHLALPCVVAPGELGHRATQRA